MTEKDLLELWLKTRNQLVLSQLAPTFLLITTVGLVGTIKDLGLYVSLAAAGILLASGILGALVQYSASVEGQAIAQDLKELSDKSLVSKKVISLGPWLNVSKFVTPAVFMGIFGALMLALFS
ncbi:MAG: hypothetical protein NTW23_06670 [Rhodoluna sp.]|nr:hypothetical protein [Rhodoluna sp.]